MTDEAQKFFTRFLAVAEHTEHAARHGACALLLHAAHRHAHVLALHDDSNATGLERFVQSEGDLARKALLHRQPPRKRLGNAGQLRKADDHTVGDIADVDLG